MNDYICDETIPQDKLMSLPALHNDMEHLILEAANGLFFAVCCNTGKIVFVSDAIKEVLGKTQTDWCGKNFFSQLHPEDVTNVKDNLNSFTPHHSVNVLDLCSGVRKCDCVRRSFMCRVRFEDSSGEQNYALLHCVGYIQQWRTVKSEIYFDSEDSSDACSCFVDCDDDAATHTCFIATGRRQVTCIDDIRDINLTKDTDKFVSRQSVDGEFFFVDQRVTAILGFEPSQLLGRSCYDFIHQADQERMRDYFDRLLKARGRQLSMTYRIRSRSGKWICIDASAFAFLNPFTHHVEYFVLTNSVDESRCYNEECSENHGADTLFTPHTHSTHEEGHSLYSVAQHVMHHVAEHVSESVANRYKPTLQARKIYIVIAKAYNRLFLMSKLAKRLCPHV